VAVDRELGGTIAALKLLATSEHLGSRDLKAFHQAAHVAVATQSTWQNVVLYAASGQPLVDTVLPFGAPAPTGANREPVERAVRGVTTLISGRWVTRSTKRSGEGTSRYALGVVVTAAALVEILRQEQLPPDRSPR
jgi:hypothetical protein